MLRLGKKAVLSAVAMLACWPLKSMLARQLVVSVHMLVGQLVVAAHVLVGQLVVSVHVLVRQLRQLLVPALVVRLQLLVGHW